MVMIGADQSVREVGAGSLLAVGICTAVLFVVSSVCYADGQKGDTRRTLQVALFPASVEGFPTRSAK